MYEYQLYPIITVPNNLANTFKQGYNKSVISHEYSWIRWMMEYLLPKSIDTPIIFKGSIRLVYDV